METTWKQAVYDIADAYREAEGTSDKISIANLKEKVRDGGGKVYLDGERIKQLEMTSYKGDNPFTMGQEGMSFDANTLIKEALQIINGVSGEDYTDTASRQTTSVDTLLREVKRKIADHKGEGEYVWKKYEPARTNVVSFSVVGTDPVTLKVSSNYVDVTTVTSEFFVGMKGTYTHNNGYVGDYEFINSTTIKVGDKNWTFTYDPMTCIISLPITNSYLVSWERYATTVDKVFIDYIISSDESAYPDGGEQDGYWYERVEGYSADEVITPEMFGYSKIVHDKAIHTADYAYITHSFNEIPQILIVTTAAELELNTNNKYELLHLLGINEGGNYMYCCKYSRNGTIYYTDGTTTLAENRIILPSGLYLSRGIEYDVFTIG